MNQRRKNHLKLPTPETSLGVGQASFLREATYGWIYILKRPGLLALLLFFTFHNLMIGVVMVLPTPMILSYASVDVLGNVMAASGAGMLLGSLVMSVWGGPKLQILGIYGGWFLRGLCLIIAGWRPSAITFAIAYSLSLFTLPIMNGSSQAIWQRKVAPDIQGRVFSIRKMLAFSSLPIAQFLAGPLAEGVFEPALMAGGPLAGSVGAVLGVGPGRGMGLMFVLAGCLLIVKTVIGIAYPRLRHLEAELPDATAT